MGYMMDGVSATLSYPRMYDLFEGIVGKRNGHAIFSSRYIRAQTGNRVLDIGCGNAKWRSHLPSVTYYGFDPNPRYIKAARDRFRDVPDCTFCRAAVEEAILDALPKFDIALALGVLHHLNDAAAIRLVKLAKAVLKNKGRLILADPCVVEGQSPIARRIMKFDRGRHIRDVNGYRDLMKATFSIANIEIRDDLIRIPYTHLIMECVAE